MTLLQTLEARVTVWRVRRVLARAMWHQEKSSRLGQKAARFMPEIRR